MVDLNVRRRNMHEQRTTLYLYICILCSLNGSSALTFFFQTFKTKVYGSKLLLNTMIKVGNIDI